MAYQDLFLTRSDEYFWYGYIATHVDYIIIAAKNTPKYMNKIEKYFQVRDIQTHKNFI